MNRTLPRLLLLLLVAAGIVGAVAIHPRLPARLATHFDASGRPDAWSSPKGLYVLGACFLGFTLFVSLGVPALVRALPASLINVPNREYWLAPERRAQAHLKLDAFMAVFGCGLAAFFLGVMALVVDANLHRQGDMRALGMWGLLGSFFAFLAGWLWRLHAGFRVPRDGPV